MANPKFLSQDGLLYVWQKLKLLLADKVDAVEGKGLSTNDYTTAEKTKLAGIDDSADVNVIESISVNGTASTITNKGVDITVPTNNNTLVNGAGYQTASDVSSAIDTAVTINAITVNGSATTISNKTVDITVPTNNASLTNGAGYQTASDVSSAIDTAVKVDTITVNGSATTVTNKTVNITVPTNNNVLTNGAGYQTASDVTTAINSAIGEITQISYQKVDALPETGEAGVIYLISHTHGTNDIFDEYIYYNSKFEKIGNTDIDLSGYLQTSAVITNSEIDTIFAS